MSMFGSLTKNIGSGLSRASEGIASMFSALINAAKNTFEFASSYTLRGFRAAAYYTMEFEKTEQNKSPSSFGENLAKAFLFLITYLPGFIIGATLGPLLYYSAVNFSGFAKHTNNLIKKYTSAEDSESVESLNYKGGPLFIYGLLGATLGLVLGTIVLTLPRLLGTTAVETYRSVVAWGINGYNFAWSDEQDFVRAKLKRRFLSTVLGSFPFGVLLSALSFVLVTAGVTGFRSVYSSLHAAWNMIAYGYNTATFDLNNRKGEYFNSGTFYKKILGMPGYIIGSVVGGVVALFITLGRTVVSSAYNFSKVFRVGFNLPWRDTKLNLINYKFKLDFSSFSAFRASIKLSYAETILGGIGYLMAPIAISLGVISGSALRVVYESFLGCLEAGTVVINHIALRGRKNDDGLNYENTPLLKRKSHERAIGFLGFPVGFVVSLLPATIIGLVRFTATNIDSGKRAFNYLAANVLPDKENFKPDNRPSWVKFFSIPGAALGFTLGGLVKLSVESYYSFINTSQFFIKNSLTYAPKDIAESKYLEIKNNNRNKFDIVWGIPGNLIGTIFNLPVVTTIVLSRFLITNADSFKREFAGQVNPKLVKNFQIKLSDDSRPEVMQKAAILGGFLGKITGFLGIVGIGSVVYFEYLSKKLTLLATYEMDSTFSKQIKLPDINNHHPIASIPGMLVGGLVGGLAFVIIGSGRVVFNSSQTIYHVTLDMVKFVRIQGEWPSYTEFAELDRYYSKDKPETPDDPTSKIRQDKRRNTPFYLGFLGLPLAIVIGLVAASTVGIFRILAQTWTRAWNESLYYSQFALPAENKLQDFQVKQTAIDKYLGSLGVILGIPLGVIGFLSLGALRMLVNTGISIRITVLSIASLPPLNYEKQPQDSRKNTEKVLGSFGYLIGLPLGFLVYTIRISANVIYHSFATGKRDIVNLSLWALGNKENKFVLGIKKQDKRRLIYLESSRSLFGQHGFGILGHIVGGGIGAGVAAISMLLRTLWHNLKSILLAFQKVSNLLPGRTWHFADEYAYKDTIKRVQLGSKIIIFPNDVMRAFKYIAATPGLVIGGALAATFVILPHYTKEFFKNNYYSYRHLGKSLINVGLEEFYFKQGVMADKRTKSEKAVGFLGYLLALVTCGLVPIAHNLLKLTSFGMAVIASPFVGFYKFIAISFYPRFNGKETQPKIQTMKDLYSALKDGEYDETTKIIPNNTGRKGVFDFMRKLFSFNLNTSTEDILAAELKKIQDPSFDLDEEINVIQQKHSGIFFFTQEVRTRRDNETKEIIKTTKETIENYLEHPEKFEYQAPKIRPRRYSDLFFYAGEDTESLTSDNSYGPDDFAV